GERCRTELLTLVRESLVTPFDRGDIHQLTVALAEVPTGLERALGGGIRHRTKEPRDAMDGFIDKLVHVAELTGDTLPSLHRLADVADYRVEVRRLGVRAEQARRELLTDVLAGRADPLRAVRITQVIEELTTALRTLEGAATVVEGIVVKES